MKDILKDIDEWTARGDKVAIAMVVSVKRSAPRPAP
jgi:xanthine/CO dehydrogenase XdhC/CoxF family maturation factor